METLWLMGMSPYFGTPCEYKKNEEVDESRTKLYKTISNITKQG